MSEIQFDKLLELKALGQVSSSGYGNGVLVGPSLKGGLKAIISITDKSGTDPTIDFKLQESDDNSTFTDIPNSKFDQISDVGFYSQEFSTSKKYVRLAWTLDGSESPTFTFWACIDRTL